MTKAYLYLALFVTQASSAFGQGELNAFKSITLKQIQATLEPIKERTLEINASNNEQNQIPAGTILVYRTNAGNFGKAVILDYDYNLTLLWVTFRSDGSLLKESGRTVLRGTWTFDFDTGQQGEGTPDVWWQQKTKTERAWTTRGKAIFAIYTGGMPAVP